MSRRSPLAALMLALLLVALAPAHALALTARSEDDLRRRWLTAKPTYTGSPYVVSPSTTAPYAAGSLQPGFVSDGLRMLNYARYAAGLPDDVTIDAGYAEKDQHAAVLLAALNTLTHSPARPSDMPDAFYQLGRAGCGSSNIAYGYRDLETSVLAYLDDEDAGNIPRLGHRRWILNPTMAKTGFGFAGSRSHSAMWSFDRTRAAAVDYDTITWPAAGSFPLSDPVSGTRFFDSASPWSITLNPARYAWSASGLTVTLRRVSDGRTWSFDSGDTSFSGDYFNVDTGGYGIANCVVFRPAPGTIAYAPGDEFDVTLSGSLYAKGTSSPRTVSYRTRFISLTSPLPRIAGPDRYATAIEISKRAFPDTDSASGVVLCTGADFPDALAASALAGDRHAPVLLNPAGALRADVLAEVRRVLPPGGGVVVLGGTGAISATAEQTLRDAGFVAERISGADRYATAAAVATEVAGGATGGTVFLATGRNFPDALAASPGAARNGWPILLARPDGLPEPTRDALARLAPSRVVVLGGTGVVPEDVRDEAREVTGLGEAAVVRWSGDDRYATAAEIARHLRAEGSSPARVAVASGRGFADALAGGAMIGEAGGLLLLSAPTSVPAALSSLLGELPTAERVDFLGGSGAFPDATCEAIWSRLTP